MTPAIAKTQLEKSESVQAYAGDVISEITTYFSTSDYARKMKPVGIAKDGHVIWGPYNQNSDGDFNPWKACDVDLCNGAYVNGNYGYAATLFHPYTVGCWGPGSSPNDIGQMCSAKPRVCILPQTFPPELSAKYLKAFVGALCVLIISIYI